ncbi:MAG: hypothetical protein KIT81_08625 [Alphaproteobacteria bacterium]|nr:hypothetical protein [Alphaproteobacteria bacterium]
MKRKLASGASCIGAWMVTSSADMAEILAYSGLDFLLIDHEHGQGSIETAIAQMRAMKGTDCTAVLRVPANDRVYIKRVLDAGVGGIMVPAIGTASEARAAVASCRYPPDGQRGAFAGMRAMQFGAMADYHASAWDDLLVVLQIESAAAVSEIPAIGEVEGVDVLFIGPRDLSASIGRLNRFEDPAVRALTAEAERAIAATGRILGSTASSGAAAAEMAGRGYRFLIAGSDATLLLQGTRSMLAAAGR